MFRQKKLSTDFISKVITLLAGKLPYQTLDDFFALIEDEIKKHYFSKESESNLLRIIQYQFDLALLIKECIQFPHYIEILIYISNNSNYLTDVLVRNPEYFFWINNPSALSEKISKHYYSRSLATTLSSYKSFDAKVNALRNFKRKEILRIGLKDIYLGNELSEITQLLSDLAITISSELFELCFTEILNKYRIKKVSNKYVIVSLGKLGGNELNYSSDIDLIAFYDKDSFINKKVYFKQILSETILLFIEQASQKTSRGFLYRIDFRLRPDGRNAPLCGSYSEYLKYYEMRGEDWERQMLIKANILCGSKKLYKKFFGYLTKFIYPSIFLVSPTEQVKKLKSSIEKRNLVDDNIKLAPGGIRDIEFSTQALQLVNGGKDESIRTGNTLDALLKLLSKNILSRSEYDLQYKSYIVFRKIEHYLQLMNDHQTHIVPVEGETAEKLSYYLGFKELSQFKSNMGTLRKQVREFFNSVFESEPIDDTQNVFDKIIFSDTQRAKQNLNYLQTGKSILQKKQFDVRTIHSFESLEPNLIEYLSESDDSDLVLENFVRIIKSANYPQIWYEELFDKNFFDLLLHLCEFSQKTIDLFAEDKLLRDEFLSRNCLIPLSSVTNNQIELKSFLFKLSIQIGSKIIDSDNFSSLYYQYLKFQLDTFTKDFIADKNWKNIFFIAAMGSFGAQELSFNSDIDLIFVVEGINKFTQIQKNFQEFLKLLSEKLTPLQIDCRLRPEGKSSLLIWDIEDYKKYLSNRARTWELHAFTKCNFMFGNQNLFNNFIDHYQKELNNRNSNHIKKDLVEMRKKLLPIGNSAFDIKKSSGGLSDLDFIVGYLLLINPKIMKARKTNGSVSSLRLLQSSNLFNLNYEDLIESFIFLKKVEIVNQNTFNTRISKIPTDDKKLSKLAKALDLKDQSSFINKLNKTTSLIRKTYQKVLTNK